MQDLHCFESAARIERHDSPDALLKDLPPPHLKAEEIIRKFSGIILVPHGIESCDEYDVKFGTSGAPGCQNNINVLSSILQTQLCPIAGVGFEAGLLLLSEQGKVYALSTSGFEFYFVADCLEDALWIVLKGKPMTPVLPRRPYTQDHNFETYEPGDAAVLWVDTDIWFCDTKT